MDLVKRPQGLRYGALAACLFLLVFYWRGLTTYFYQDDFGWLHLGPAHSIADVVSILFAPKAHGNIRPWSENLYFWGLHAVFGVRAWPFRVVVFATAMATLFLLEAVVRRLTGSAWAAFAACIFWLANPVVAAALCWSSIYNQTQYLFFILLAFLLFLRGQYGAQLAVFALGLGSLELVVGYPAIVALYALLYDRTKLKRTIPLFAISAAFVVLHFVVAPAPRTGPYALQWDSRVAGTLGTYVELALGPERFGHFFWEWPRWCIAAATAAMLAGVAAALYCARRAALFGAGWFLVLLAPVLPLPEHILDYLLTGPAMGLAIVLAAPLATRRRAWFAVLGVFYLAAALPAAWSAVTWNYQRSRVSKQLVDAVVGWGRRHPGRTLMLTGMSREQFDAAYSNLPFDVMGLGNVYLAPGADAAIQDAAGIAHLYVLAPEKSDPLLAAGKAAVLDVHGGAARDVTPEYMAGRAAR